jgi:serine/threonine protein kinase
MVEDRLNSLLLAWQEQQLQGRDVAPADLCRDCPELAPELARRIAVLSQINNLLPSGDTPPAPNLTPPAPATGDRPYGSPSAGSSETITRQGPSPLENPSVPESVPGYEILEELGRGGMGVVYKARQRAINRLVALKMILAGPTPSAEAVARFRGEAEAVGRLQHPNVVQIHEVGKAGDRPFFSLEFVDGGTLADRVGQTPQPPAKAARLVEVVARAVHAAHRRGVIHRDLKPGNVLLAAATDAELPTTDYGVPKVSDFGLAKLLDSDAGHTQTGSAVGTPSYMAPEQAKGELKAIGPATDVYALGAILYHLLTGRPPFQGPTALEVMIQVTTHPPLPPRHLQSAVPPELEAICLKCLNKQPRDRYASAEALADDLGRFLGGRPVEAPTPVAGHAQWRWSRRHLGLAAAVLLVGLVPLVWWWLFTPGSHGPDQNVPSGSGGRSAGPAPSTERLSGELIVRVWTKGTREKQGLRVEEPGALPVCPGEQIHVQARLNQPAYIYLLWLDGKGEVTPLYPWHDNNEDLVHTLAVPPPRRSPVAEVDSPKALGKGYGLDDAAGLETVLLLARRTPFPGDQSLVRLLGKVPAAELNDPLEIALLSHNRGPRGGNIDWSRNRGIKKKPEEIDAPLLQLMARLAAEFEVIRAVRFAHLGK